jgi:hypothetical protein
MVRNARDHHDGAESPGRAFPTWMMFAPDSCRRIDVAAFVPGSMRTSEWNTLLDLDEG